MVNRTKLTLCSGLLLAILSTGCTGARSFLGSTVGSSTQQSHSQATRKRMLVIAQTYETQGHKQRALTAYRQVFKQYPRSSQAKIAQQKYAMLKNSKQSTDPDKSHQPTMLAKKSTPPKLEEQSTKSEPKLLASAFPEIANNTVESAVPKLLIVDNDIDLPAFPELLEPDESAELTELKPFPTSASRKNKKEELLSPPAVVIVEVLAPVEEPQSDEGWVVTNRENESTDAVQDQKENEVNQRLAALAYQIGYEEQVEEDVFDSLKILLEHEDQQVRINSAEALFRQGRGSEKALNAIGFALSSNEESDRVIAVHALSSAYQKYPEQTVQMMVSHLEEDTPFVQSQVALLLGEFREDSEKLISTLEQTVDESSHEQVRDAAMLSIICLKE